MPVRRRGSLRTRVLAWVFVPPAIAGVGLGLVLARVFRYGVDGPASAPLIWLLPPLWLLTVAVTAFVAARGADRVTRSIAALGAAMDDVAQGRFGDPLAVDADDEVGRLVERFNAMTSQIEATRRGLDAQMAQQARALADNVEAGRRQAEQFRVLVEVSQRMTSLAGVGEMLDHIVKLIQEAFGYYHVGIGLVEDDVVVYRAGAGPLWNQPNAAFVPARLKIGQEGVTGLVAGTGRPLLLPDVSAEPSYVEMQGSRARSELAVPIQAKGKVIGVLDVQSADLGAFDESDLAVLQSLANQAAIAIENAQLYEQARDLAVIEERQRVARDLHDSVTQSLYGVTLFADGAARLLGADQPAAAARYVDQLRETAREALRQMRLLIFELRPPELATVGLVAALQGRLDTVEARAGYATELSTDGDVRAAPETEAALYRIAQEALNNTLKHARARSVCVELSRLEGALRLRISDDGVGFDPETARVAGGLGLRSMRERAARLGGTVQLESMPGAGTRLTVEVPL